MRIDMQLRTHGRQNAGFFEINAVRAEARVLANLSADRLNKLTPKQLLRTFEREQLDQKREQST